MPVSESVAVENMIVHRASPMNAETRPEILAASFITRQQDFYIRSHGDVPRLTSDGYKLNVTGPSGPAAFSMHDLRSRFPRRSVTCVLQCAGNRRADMLAVKPVSGDPWQVGAIGNAEWTGVALTDVLSAVGVTDAPNRHVVFTAHDTIDGDDRRARYSVSIPLAKAMAPETLLAFEMNGAPLTAEHGFPVRVVVPRYAGVRSPKWLASIIVQDQPASSDIQQKEYKRFAPDETKETADYDAAPTINDMPLTSAILTPGAGATLPPGGHVVRGYAIAAGQPVAEVEVSADAGRTWQRAELERMQGTEWSWVFWTARIALTPGPVTLVARAFDAAGSGQPETTASIWNFPGYLATAWHRVPVTVAIR